jgi:predicted dehydrogenase/NADPH:quinone reductase-like Zn-dependent oxidoreductase
MKQVAQNLRSGEIAVAEVPAPAMRGPGVLVATSYSVLSPGTERAAVELGRASLLGKALRRPDQVRKVLDTVRREGLGATLRKVREKLDVERAMGYSAAGVVLESRDAPFVPGDRVACAGTGAATHAEINFVPRNLCARVPQGVALDEAAFAALGAIALHALRLGEAALGEDVAVVGLGVLGLILAQALRAAGCRVTGFDLRADRLAAATRVGVDQIAVPSVEALQPGAGFDRVFLCAASRSAEPVEFAVEAARDRARIVVVGDVRTDFPRNACYEKELSIVYARSYGPGRYDQAYEEQGHDYPRAYVPWTAQRNLAAFLDLIARRQMTLEPLITHRLSIDDAERAYDIVSGAEPSLGVVLEYPVVEGATTAAQARTVELRPREPRQAGTLSVVWIGAGSYAVTALLPHLAADKRMRLLQVVNARGLSAKHVADQFGFAACSTDPASAIADTECDAVFIATRHGQHAPLAAAALEAGKAVFVEKPLAITHEQLHSVEEARIGSRIAAPAAVGFNRRFAPATQAVREFLAAQQKQPVSIRYAVRAGAVPPQHWLHDPSEGGRIAGEVCHFVDWCMTMAGAPLVRVFASIRGAAPGESLHATLEFEGGGQASLVYEPAPPHGLPKERIEISRGDQMAIVEDFREVTFLSRGGRKRRSFQGKGQKEMMAAVLDAFLDGREPHPFTDAISSTRATLLLLESAASSFPCIF